MPREGEEDSQKAEENPTQKNQCIGVSRGGRSTKIHAVVDALGNPIHVQLSAGNVHDVKVAQEMLEAVKLRPGMAVLADKAYGKWELREFIANTGADFCIPPKSNESDPWFRGLVALQGTAFGGNLFLEAEGISPRSYPL